MFDFTEDVLKHADVLASYAHKLTKDKHNAQDLCQETLFKALANRESFDRGSDVRPWLFTIMRNFFSITIGGRHSRKNYSATTPARCLITKTP